MALLFAPLSERCDQTEVDRSWDTGHLPVSGRQRPLRSKYACRGNVWSFPRIDRAARGLLACHWSRGGGSVLIQALTVAMPVVSGCSVATGGIWSWAGTPSIMPRSPIRYDTALAWRLPP